MTHSTIITLDAAHFSSVVLVTCIVILQKYCYMLLGAGLKESKSSAQKHWAARAFGNYGEQFPLFMTALWMYAIFVSPDNATKLGFAYIIFRVLYVLVWLVGGAMDTVKGTNPAMMGVTMPMYCIILYMTASSMSKAYFHYDLDGFYAPTQAPLFFGPLSMAPLMTIVMIILGVFTSATSGFFAEDEEPEPEVAEDIPEKIPLVPKAEPKAQAVPKPADNGCCVIS